MTLIYATQLSKSYGANDLFEDLSLSVPPKGHIGLIGANGIGKSTLLRILLGLEEPSSGRVVKASGLRIGYLPQGAHLDSSKTLWQECLSVFSALTERQSELHDLEQQLSQAAEHEEILELYGKKQAEFEALGGYEYELRIRQTLSGLGFTREDESMPVPHLSGGQRTRAYLAKLLLEDPDLLLLDEPTNHLDIQAVEWLEDYLNTWPGEFILVSHDRYFLDKVANTIWEMTPALEIYKGNYSAYLTQRDERYQWALKLFEKQQEFIQKEEDYIRRNIEGQNVKQAIGRRRRLERLMRDSLLARPPQNNEHISLRMQSTLRAGDLVLRTHDLAIGYQDDQQVLFHSPDLLLQRGECAAIIGPNGAGKTTFLKTLLEQMPPLAGEVQWGASLKIGYFAQTHEGLNPEQTLMEAIDELAPRMLPGEIRDYLARFLFQEDDVFKKISVLSGGERGRLALALLALQGANLLLLDEPTNHLDLSSQEILQRVLKEFNGTILLVSHDRYLIDALGSQIWDVLPTEKQLEVFKGSYSEYKRFLQQKNQAESEPAVKPVIGEIKEEKPTDKGLSKHQLKRLQQKREALEEEITRIEWEIEKLQRLFQNPPADPQMIQQLGKDYTQYQKKLDTLLNEWGALEESAA